MASQLTLQTKVKLPSGHEIPQLGYGVSAIVSGLYKLIASTGS